MKRKIILISMILLLFLGFSAVQAEGNSTATVNEKTFDAIQQTIDNSTGSSTIELEGAYYGNSTPINVNRSITMKGSSSGATLSAGEKSQIVTVSADDVVFENLVFLRGTSKYSSGFEYGGAIYATGNNLKIVNCTFMYNYAQYGAAISSSGENVSIIDCRFSHNTVQYSGGAIELDGDNCCVGDCIFEDNSAGHVGSAVAWVGANGILSNSVFDNFGISLSKSPQFGGAVVWMGSNGTLSQSTFKNFKSKKSGAAIYWKGEGGKLNYCIFEDNEAQNDMAYYGNPQNVEYNYWGASFSSPDSFRESRLIYYNESFASPESWVNIRQSSDSIDFVSNDGSALDNYLPDYLFKNIVISKNSYIIPKSTKLAASNIVTYSLYNGKYLKVTLKSGNNALSSKYVQIKLNGETYNRKTGKNGVVSLQIKLKDSKDYKATISFKGDKWYKSSSKTVKITVKKQKPKFSIKIKGRTVKVTLKDQFKKALAKKVVKLTVNKRTFKVKTNSKGTATFKLNLKAKKTYGYKVKFSGNKYYKGITKSGKISVK